MIIPQSPEAAREPEQPLPKIILEPFLSGPGWYLWIDGEIVGATASDKFIDSVKEILAQGSAFRSARGPK
jgi:hypothetical protein